MADTVEIRLEMPRDEIAVLDGFVNATGDSRAEVIRGILGEWSAKQRRIAISVCRTAGINPRDADTERR